MQLTIKQLAYSRMDHYSLISIIIPCYNQGCFLSETLTSISVQTYQNWEALIIDDGSTDNTAQVAKKWVKKDSRFTYFYKENGGLSDARNYGINKAKGSYIQFLDSDDLLVNEKLEKQIKILQTNKCDITICSSEYFYDNDYSNKYINNFGLEVIENSNNLNKELLELLITDNKFPVSAPLIKTNSIHKTGYFDTLLTSLEDWDFWLRLIMNNAIFHINLTREPLNRIRIRGNSMSTNTFNMSINRIAVYNKILASKVTLTAKQKTKINFHIIDSLKQCLYQLDNKTNNNSLFQKLEKHISIGLRYRLFRFIFSLKLFPPTTILWLVYDFSPQNIFTILKNKLKK